MQHARAGTDREQRMLETEYYVLAGTYKAPLCVEWIIEDIEAVLA